MTAEDFRERLALLEAKANIAYGAMVNRRAGNGGRYWALGSVIAAMSSEQEKKQIEAWLVRETFELEGEYYTPLG
jgi:hypothetical protein